ncbi:hypothetical protein Tco_1068137 [Tanacetum coccineum]|uniref:Uncharacterized protein n=1 Tax=Tanacetum coccineum TaxID=301880 RepID=A0ABQ5HEV8_9ASTR
MGIACKQPMSHPSQAQGDSSSFRGPPTYYSYGGYASQALAGSNIAIEDYPLPDGLKIPLHVGSYDGKGEPDNFLHLFEGNGYQERRKKKGEFRKIKWLKIKNWKIPICYDDDEDYTIAITPVLSTKEPVDSLIMEDEHLDTILATESDEVIKSSVENLVQIPSESKDISDDDCDVPLCDNPTPLEAFKEHSETIVDSNNDSTSSDDDYPYGEDIDYELMHITSRC